MKRTENIKDKENKGVESATTGCFSYFASWVTCLRSIMASFLLFDIWFILSRINLFKASLPLKELFTVWRYSLHYQILEFYYTTND